MTRRMNPVSLLLLCSLLIPIDSAARTGWYHLPSPGMFRGIFFVDSLHGWIHGSPGISATTDGG